jgi:hypothetical protein
MLSWYKGVIGTNFVPQISTMVLIICTMVQRFEFWYRKRTGWHAARGQSPNCFQLTPPAALPPAGANVSMWRGDNCHRLALSPRAAVRVEDHLMPLSNTLATHKQHIRSTR